tara:strand:- start:1008 stop:1490 length:483 start_codon:yes stop_codon:yes gene_type:complete
MLVKKKYHSNIPNARPSGGGLTGDTMLTEEQIAKALAAKTYDSFYDRAADVTVHIAHTSQGAYYVVFDEPGVSVLQEMSFFIPYVWLAAANSRTWPRHPNIPYQGGNVMYFTQMKLHKKGKRFFVTKHSTVMDDKAEEFNKKVPKEIRKIEDFIFPLRKK